jgi:hypothetical protein
MTPKRTLLVVMMLCLLAIGLMIFVQPKPVEAQITYTPGPKVVYTKLHANLSDSLASQALPSLPAGVYRATFIQWVTTTSVAGSCQGAHAWQTEAANAGENWGGALNTAIATVPRYDTKVIRNKAGGIPSYSVTCTGLSGVPVYQLWVMYEKLS